MFLSSLSGHVQPAGKNCADLVVSQAWPLGQWEACGGGGGVAWVTKGGWETLLCVGPLTSFEGEIFST